MRPNLSHPKYRSDIDGLRALAVLSVVGFHAFPSWFSGGFIGVDVFFVISGFLISTIIFQNLEKETFSFTEFYSRRIKRIFPALLLVLISSYFLGWFVLLSDEYKQLGKHIAAGVGFISNFILWNESGYFDNSAETKPLLHLWSLGIEEQFYIVWPLMLWITWRIKLKLIYITILVLAISFCLNITETRKDILAAFYSPQTRFWELLCGSILAWLTLYIQETYASINNKLDDQTLANTLSFFGLSLLSFGFYTINKNYSFPGIWAILPVLGAVLIIAAGPWAWFNRIILSNRLMVKIGLISFPLYLWHWPLLSFARIFEGKEPTAGIRTLVVALSFVLAWFTYRFVERTVRLGWHSSSKIITLIVLLLGIGLVGYYTYIKDGLGFRAKDSEGFVSYYENSFPEWKYFKRINLSKQWRSECAFFNGKMYLVEGSLEGGVTDSRPVEGLDESCYKRDLNFNKSVLIWGDSHAQALSPGIVNNIPKEWQILQIASSGCHPNPNIEIPSSVSQCSQSNYFAMKTIKDAKPDVVVVAQETGHSVVAMRIITEKLVALGVKRILFVGPTPHWTADLPKIIARQLWSIKPKYTYVGLNQDFIKVNYLLMNQFRLTDEAEYIDVIGLFCNEMGCLTHTGDDLKDTITTWDYGHMTPSASNYLAKNLLISKIVSQ